jgi:hypothetical protein
MKMLFGILIISALIISATEPVFARAARIPKANQIDLFTIPNPQTGKSYCPDHIFTQQQLHSTGDAAVDSHIAVLAGTESTRRNNLETIDFYSGPARGLAQLKPEQYGKTSRWIFSQGDGIHYVCRYEGTNVTLDAPLDADIAKCEETPYKNKYGIEQRQVICTRRK